MMPLRLFALLSLMAVVAPAATFRHGVGLRTAPEVDVAPRSFARSSAAQQFNLQRAGFTPYDRYLGTVRSVFVGLDVRRPSIAEACRLLRASRAFRYVSRDPYRADSPEVTTARRAGDCKAKALWLYDRLGDPSAHYVIGKLHPRAKAAHAWLYWRWDGRWWILDPTNLSNPVAADSVGRSRYVPYYSFTRDGAYRHPATHLLIAAQNVAERR